MSAEWPLILAYHHLSEHGASRYVMPVSHFEGQLNRMLERGFRALPLETALESGPHGTGAASAGTFTLTFDDALSSFARLAFPVLERLNLLSAATVFVPTRFVGADNEWIAHPTFLQRIVPWSDVPERLLSWGDVERLRTAGVSFESHGHGHLAMQDLTYEQALEDAETSKRILAEHGIFPRYFALPFGWRSTPAKNALRDAGFEAAFAVKWGGGDRFEVRRVPMYGTDSALAVRWKLSGRYFDALDALRGPRRGRTDL